MKIRPIAAAACLAALALFGTACGTDKPGSTSPNAAEQTGDAKADLKAALDKSAEQGLVHLQVTSDKMTVKAEIDRTHKRMHATISGSSEGMTMGMEMIFVDGKSYQKHTEGPMVELLADQLDGKEWLTSTSTLSAYLDDENLLGIKDLLDSSALLPGKAKVTANGTTYTVENGGGIDPEGSIGLLTGTGEDSGDAKNPQTMVITLDAQGLVASFEAKGESSTSITFTFGAAVDVQAPDPSTVAEL